MSIDETALWISEQCALWERRVQTASSTAIDADSAMAEDQDLPGGWTTAKLAWRALGTAGEHIGAAHNIFSSTNGGVRTKPFATLSRTATLGAARTLYLLDSDSPSTRRVRSLQLLRREAEDAMKLLKISRMFPSGDAKVAEQKISEIKDACEGALVQLDKKPGSGVSEWDLLQNAASHLTSPRDPSAAISYLWNYNSATAHARALSWDAGVEDQEIVVQYATIWSIPLGLMDAAWNLWCLRRST